MPAPKAQQTPVKNYSALKTEIDAATNDPIEELLKAARQHLSSDRLTRLEQLLMNHGDAVQKQTRSVLGQIGHGATAADLQNAKTEARRYEQALSGTMDRLKTAAEAIVQPPQNQPNQAVNTALSKCLNDLQKKQQTILNEIADTHLESLHNSNLLRVCHKIARYAAEGSSTWDRLRNHLWFYYLPNAATESNARKWQKFNGAAGKEQDEDSLIFGGPEKNLDDYPKDIEIPASITDARFNIRDAENAQRRENSGEVEYYVVTVYCAGGGLLFGDSSFQIRLYPEGNFSLRGVFGFNPSLDTLINRLVPIFAYLRTSNPAKHEYTLDSMTRGTSNLSDKEREAVYISLKVVGAKITDEQTYLDSLTADDRNRIDQKIQALQKNWIQTADEASRIAQKSFLGDNLPSNHPDLYDVKSFAAKTDEVQQNIFNQASDSERNEFIERVMAAPATDIPAANKTDVLERLVNNFFNRVSGRDRFMAMLRQHGQNTSINPIPLFKINDEKIPKSTDVEAYRDFLEALKDQGSPCYLITEHKLYCLQGGTLAEVKLAAGKKQTDLRAAVGLRDNSQFGEDIVEVTDNLQNTHAGFFDFLKTGALRPAKTAAERAKQVQLLNLLTADNFNKIFQDFAKNQTNEQVLLRSIFHDLPLAKQELIINNLITQPDGAREVAKCLDPQREHGMLLTAADGIRLAEALKKLTPEQRGNVMKELSQDALANLYLQAKTQPDFTLINFIRQYFSSSTNTPNLLEITAENRKQLRRMLLANNLPMDEAVQFITALTQLTLADVASNAGAAPPIPGIKNYASGGFEGWLTGVCADLLHSTQNTDPNAQDLKALILTASLYHNLPPQQSVLDKLLDTIKGWFGATRQLRAPLDHDTLYQAGLPDDTLRKHFLMDFFSTAKDMANQTNPDTAVNSAAAQRLRGLFLGLCQNSQFLGLGDNPAADNTTQVQTDLLAALPPKQAALLLADSKRLATQKISRQNNQHKPMFERDNQGKLQIVTSANDVALMSTAFKALTPKSQAAILAEMVALNTVGLRPAVGGYAANAGAADNAKRLFDELSPEKQIALLTHFPTPPTANQYSFRPTLIGWLAAKAAGAGPVEKATITAALGTVKSLPPPQGFANHVEIERETQEALGNFVNASDAGTQLALLDAATARDAATAGTSHFLATYDLLSNYIPYRPEHFYEAIDGAADPEPQVDERNTQGARLANSTRVLNTLYQDAQTNSGQNNRAKQRYDQMRRVFDYAAWQLTDPNYGQVGNTYATAHHANPERVTTSQYEILADVMESEENNNQRNAAAITTQLLPEIPLDSGAAKAAFVRFIQRLDNEQQADLFVKLLNQGKDHDIERAALILENAGNDLNNRTAAQAIILARVDQVTTDNLKNLALLLKTLAARSGEEGMALTNATINAVKTATPASKARLLDQLCQQDAKALIYSVMNNTAEESVKIEIFTLCKVATKFVMAEFLTKQWREHFKDKNNRDSAASAGHAAIIYAYLNENKAEEAVSYLRALYSPVEKDTLTTLLAQMNHEQDNDVLIQRFSRLLNTYFTERNSVIRKTTPDLQTILIDPNRQSLLDSQVLISVLRLVLRLDKMQLNTTIRKLCVVDNNVNAANSAKLHTQLLTLAQSQAAITQNDLTMLVQVYSPTNIPQQPQTVFSLEQIGAVISAMHAKNTEASKAAAQMLFNNWGSHQALKDHIAPQYLDDFQAAPQQQQRQQQQPR